MNALKGVVSIFVAVIVMFFAPLYNMAEKEDRVVQTYVSDRTGEFVNSIRNSGRLTKEMFEQFSNELESTSNLYKIKITHRHGTYYPVCDDTGSPTGEVEVSYVNTYENDILTELYEGDGEYTFSEGDYISVVIYNRNRTLANTMQAFVLGSSQETAIYCSRGGKIRDET